MGLVLTTSGNFAYDVIFGFSRAEDDFGPFVGDLILSGPSGPGDSLSEFTLASFPGYAQVQLFPASAIVVDSGGDGWSQDWGPLFFQLTSNLPIPGVTVTGYVVSDAGGSVLWYNTISGGFIFLNAGDMLTITQQLDIKWRYS